MIPLLAMTLPVGVEVAIRVLVVIAVFFLVPLVIGQTEHKMMAHMQGRLGPMYAGAWHGWAQLVADAVKFIQKEDVAPAAADRKVFKIAPFVAMLPYMFVLLLLPIGPKNWQIGQSLDLGLFVALALTSVGIIGILMAGWASNNKYALIGGVRAAAQLIAYELPLVLSAASVAMAAGTLSLQGIVHQWKWWWLFWQLPAAIVFFIAGIAEVRRPPFDMPFAESELVFGPLTEYTGLRFALFLFAEYAGIVVMSALTTILFLGGWKAPFASVALAPLWTLIKVFVLSCLVIWFRVAYPRLREDQLQRFAWVVLVPVALAQIVLTGIVKVAIS